MPLTIDGQANSITSSVGGVNIPATVGTLSVGPSGSYMIANSSGVDIIFSSISTPFIIRCEFKPNGDVSILGQSDVYFWSVWFLDNGIKISTKI